MAVMMQYGGVAVFILIYLYVWFRNYKRALDQVDAFATNDMSLAEVTDELNTSEWEIMGVLLIIFLILLLIVLTILRGLSHITLGTPFDLTLLYIALSWFLEDKVDYALFCGATIASAVIVGVSATGRMMLLAGGARHRWLRRLFIGPYAAQVDPQQLRKSVMRVCLVVSLLTLIVTFILIYGNMELPASRSMYSLSSSLLLGGVMSAMRPREKGFYGISGYRRDLREAIGEQT